MNSMTQEVIESVVSFAIFAACIVFVNAATVEMACSECSVMLM